MKFEFSEQEATVILNALGQMPYIEVFQLIAKLQEQAKKQLEEKY